MARKLTAAELKEFLDNKVNAFNNPAFIKDDPISIPHRFSRKEDIEICAFLVATISWGQRPVILSNGARLMQLMDDQPYEFILNASGKEIKRLKNFVHRTFNGQDVIFFTEALKNIYKNSSGLEQLFSVALKKSNGKMGEAISIVRKEFFSYKLPGRSSKHFSDPLANSAAKRINMMLRWLVRTDKKGVDFGIWKSISPSLLYCPLDVHSGRVARELGLLKRTQNDWKAVDELTQNLRLFDKNDPVKYDFALFGLGISKGL